MSNKPEAPKPSLTEALAAMEKAANFVDRFTELRTAISAGTGLEQNIRELTTAAEARRGDLAAVEARVDEANARLAVANDETQKVYAAAKEKGDDIVAKAVARAEKITSEANTAVTDAEARLVDINTQVGTANAELEAISDEIKKAESRLEKAQAQIKKLLG